MRVLVEAASAAWREGVGQRIERKETGIGDLQSGAARAEREAFTEKNGDVIALPLAKAAVETDKARCFKQRGADFLARFAHSGCFGQFTAANCATGKVPVWLIGVLHQRHLPVLDQHHAHTNRDRAQQSPAQAVYAESGAHDHLDWCKLLHVMLLIERTMQRF